MDISSSSLVEALHHPDWQKRQEAAQALGDHDAATDAVARLTLIAALTDPVYWVRRSAAISLAQTKDPSVIEEAMQKVSSLFSDDTPLHRMLILEFLTHAPGGEAMRTLLDNLEAEDPLIRNLALNGLVEKQEPAALVKLCALKEKGGKNIPQLNEAIAMLTDCAAASLALLKKKVFCSTCLRRLQEEKIKSGKFGNIGLAACPSCRLIDSPMEGVVTSVAVLAEPWDQPWRREGEELYVNMMPRDRKNAYMIDFDCLEIWEAPAVNLDEEVKFFLMRASEDLGMRSDQLKKTPVRLRGNPKLNVNSRLLLSNKMTPERILVRKAADGRLVEV